MTLPPNLIGAISDPPGGRVAIITGAGTSFESPTGLPLSRELALQTHHRLVRDGYLDLGDCDNASNLSAVADAVHEAEHPARVMVDRMDPNLFRAATPNIGHLIAAALLREKAIASFMTLNFDLAMSSALAELGGAQDVTIISGPQDHDRMGAFSLIYLHRNAEASADAWILRTEQMDAWEDSWEEVVAARVMTCPVVAFAGLGTPASVLIHTARKVRGAARGHVYHVDPNPYGSSVFDAELGIDEDHFIEAGWSDFMKQVGELVTEEHRRVLDTELNALADQYDLADHHRDTSIAICQALIATGLVQTGRLRSVWFLDDSKYLPHDETRPRWLAVLIASLGAICAHYDLTVEFQSDGSIRLWKASTLKAVVLLAHGRADHNWTSFDARIKRRLGQWSTSLRYPQAILSAGIEGAPLPNIVPADIVDSPSDDSIIEGPGEPQILLADTIIEHPDAAEFLFRGA